MNSKNIKRRWNQIGYLGRHLIVELFDCNPEKINDEKFLEKILVESLIEAGSKILGKFFYKFQPQGVTGIIAIAESHLSLHTWPEKNYAALDIFTCGVKIDPWKVYRRIVEEIKPKKVKILELSRGPLTRPKILEEVLAKWKLVVYGTQKL